MLHTKKLFKSADVSRSYSNNNTGTIFLRHGVYLTKSRCRQTEADWSVFSYPKMPVGAEQRCVVATE